MTHVLRSHDQRRYETPGGNTTTPLAAPATGATQLLAIRQHQAPGGHNPLHRKSTEALVIVLDGEISIGAHDDTALLAGGDTALIAAGELHQIRNTGTAPATWLVITPGDVMFSAEDGAPVEPVWAT